MRPHQLQEGIRTVRTSANMTTRGGGPAARIICLRAWLIMFGPLKISKVDLTFFRPLIRPDHAEPRKPELPIMRDAHVLDLTDKAGFNPCHGRKGINRSGDDGRLPFKPDQAPLQIV